MKKKITISLDENILERIDKSVKNLEGKNRSAVIENILKERYGDFVDVTAIIFAHDYKWDNRPYPFDIPKALLKVRDKTIITRQVEAFTKPWIKNIIVLIPNGTTELFKDELVSKFPHINFQFLELDPELKTWAALREALKLENTSKNLLISNWDIFYWRCRRIL